MKAAVYLRVSTVKQAGAGHVSLDVQRERCLAFCAEKGWQVATLETDTESGLKATRTGYQRILGMARTKQIQHIVVYAASRFGRKASEVLSRIEELREYGVELHSTQEDLSSFLMVGITAVINEEQSRTIARLSVPAKLSRAKDGYWLAHAPFGTVNEKGILKPDSRADILREMFNMAASGHSVRQITIWANGLIDKPLTREGVREVLRNTAYIGRTRWAGEEFPGRWEPIVDKRIFRRAQKVVTSRKFQRAAIDQERPHWIVGLAYCVCGTRMSRSIRVKAWGTKYEYLACQRRDYARITVGCGARLVRLRPFQEQAIAEIRRQVGVMDLGAIRHGLAQRRDDAAASRSQERAALTRERSRLQDRLTRARQGYMDQVYEAAEYHRLTAGIKDAIANIDELLLEDEPVQAAGLPAFEVLLGDDWTGGATLAPLEFRDFLRLFIERIEVPLKIHWRAEIADLVKVKR